MKRTADMMAKVYEFDKFNSSMLHMPPTSCQFPATYQDLSLNKKYGRIFCGKKVWRMSTQKKEEKRERREQDRRATGLCRRIRLKKARKKAGI